MALTYNRQVRTLGIRGVITLTTGAQINISAEDVLHYSISESCGEDGLPLGTAEAASFELTINNVGKGYTPDMFDNAEVHMQIGIETDGVITYSDFGVWYVCDVTAPEQSISIDLSGYDALATLFEVDYTDSKGAYPTSLGSLASTICAAAGITIKSRSFVNADIQVSKMPEWGEGATLRSIIGFISACAGGFAHIDRSGLLEIVSYNSGSEYEVDPDLYSMLTRTNGTNFRFNALQVKFIDSDDDTYTRYALQSSVEDNPTNTIRIENNPLFTEGIANSVVAALTGVSANPVTINWVGDPSVNLGDVLIATNRAGVNLRLIINSQSFSFSGGFNAESACSLPALNTINSGSYTSSGNIMDGNGNIRATRITDLDKTVLSAMIGHFNSLDAETIRTDTLVASIIDAVTLKAQNISAESVETDILTASVAEIINATIRKLVAGTITTDELYAAYAELITLKVGTITADNITTDSLAAELARITVLAAGSATFDRATVTHLVAEAMNLDYGVAGQVFIKNLAVEYAQMIGATIGSLCIRASDGNYYAIDVDENGNVSATKTTVSSGEISAGQTDAGRVILETNITAANLSTSNLLATYALVNQIDAARIDVAELFAQRAFIDLLTTSNIIGDKSLTIIAGEASDALSAVNNLQVGGRNLLLKSATKHITAYSGANLTFTDGVSVSEWGTTDAIRCTGAGGTTTAFGIMRGVSVNVTSVLDQDYVHSLYIRNDGPTTVRVTNNNLGGSASILSGESRRVVLKNPGNGRHALQFVFASAAVGDEINLTYWHPKIELGNVATDWSPAPEDVDSDFAQYVTQIGGEIEDLQNQIDGSITTWFYDDPPTTANAPAKDWTTDALKNQHLGDLYYDASGYCYRWQLSGGVYGWTQLADSGVTEALKNAKKAQDTADGKRRVFVAQPVPPYDEGDMWAQGEGGDLMRCATAKAEGAIYAASDWVKASKYTDDTLAQQTQDRLNNLQIGGRNLLQRSATQHIRAYSGATFSFTDGVIVTEWGATDAIRCTGTGGTSTVIGKLDATSPNTASVANQAYTHSIYIRNDSEDAIRIGNNNLSANIAVQPGESRRVILNGTGNGTQLLQFSFITATAGAAFNITYWHPKIELGNTVTDWTPAPEDNEEIFTGENPPALPIKTGALWIDTGVTPTVIRRWKGADTDADRDGDGWDTVSDLEEINRISSTISERQLEDQRRIERLETALTIDNDGVHVYKPEYRGVSEVRIDHNSVDILVNGDVNSSFIAGGLILGNYRLWHPAAAGGLAFNLYTEA